MQENFSEYNRTMQNANMTAYHLAQMREVEISTTWSGMRTGLSHL